MSYELIKLAFEDEYATITMNNPQIMGISLNNDNRRKDPAVKPDDPDNTDVNSRPKEIPQAVKPPQ